MATKKKDESTELVAEVQSFAVADIDESQYAANFAFEANEKAMSFLKQAQAMSPELDKTNTAYVKGLEMGGLFVTGADKVYNEGCYIVPCYMKHEHIFWKKDNGGFDGKAPWIQEVQDQLLRDGSKNFLPDGRQVEDALTYYLLVIDPENPNQLPTPAILKCASTKVTIAKKLNTLLNTAQFENKLPNGTLPAIYRFLISITSVSQTNAQQQKFYNINFARAKEHAYLNQKGLIAVPAILDLAKNLADLASADGVNVDYNADKDVQNTQSADAGIC
jgi:hypothetical protein